MTTVKIKRYAPNYDTKCCVCDQSPVVDMVGENEKHIYTTDMCGPCTWGEARTLDPDTWNEDVK